MEGTHDRNRDALDGYPRARAARSPWRVSVRARVADGGRDDLGGGDLGAVTVPSGLRKIAPGGEDRRTAPAGGARILFADDDDWLCVLASARLRLEGHHVYVV